MNSGFDAPAPCVTLPPKVVTCAGGRVTAWTAGCPVDALCLWRHTQTTAHRPQQAACTNAAASIRALHLPPLPPPTPNLDGLARQQLGGNPPQPSPTSIVALSCLHLFICQERLPGQLLHSGGRATPGAGSRGACVARRHTTSLRLRRGRGGVRWRRARSPPRSSGRCAGLARRSAEAAMRFLHRGGVGRGIQVDANMNCY